MPDRRSYDEAMAPWICPRCEGFGVVGWGDERCPKCKGARYIVTGEQVAALVNLALDRMAEGEGTFNPLHVRNVIMNTWIGPELPYRRVKYALGRNPRVEYRGTKRDALGSVPMYGWAAA